MGCKREKNLEGCTCTFACKTKGICCDCVKHHRDAGQIPGCFFPKDIEATYDRSIRNFVRAYSHLL